MRKIWKKISKNSKKYYIENQESIREKLKKYYNENQESIKQYQKKYRNENQESLREYQRKYKIENCDKRNQNERNRRRIDDNFRLTHNLRSRTYHAFKSQNVRKTNKSMDLLGCSHSLFKKWIQFQLHGDMTLENYGKIWQIDHCLPINSFSLLNENEMKKCFNWLNLRPMYSEEIISKKATVDQRLYLLQEIKAHYFLKIKW